MDLLEKTEIYLVRNTVNGKLYVGKAWCYARIANGKLYRHGAANRFKRHVTSALGNNSETSNECPAFYHDIRQYGSDAFYVEVLETCDKAVEREREEFHIRNHQSHESNKGYNILLSAKRPIDEQRAECLSAAIADSNHRRSANGALRQSVTTACLPPNVNLRIRRNDDGSIRQQGYFAQIKIGGKLYNRGFMSSKVDMETKLRLATEFIDGIKKEYGTN
jgi:hypothetical protein